MQTRYEEVSCECVSWCSDEGGYRGHYSDLTLCVCIHCVQVKAKVQGRIASSGETGELLHELEGWEGRIKWEKENVERYQRLISEHQQRLESVQEGTELMFVVWLCHWL